MILRDTILTTVPGKPGIEPRIIATIKRVVREHDEPVMVDNPFMLFDATAADVEGFAQRLMNVAARAKRQRQPRSQT